MTNTSSDANPTNLLGWEEDDLTAIKGIGAAREQWLRESLNVHTFQDLAALSVDEIESELKAEGRAVPRNEIKEWIAEARERAGIDLPSPPIMEPAVESGMTANSLAVEDAWKPLASFVVEFQVRQVAGQVAEERTTVHYMEADRSEEWPGVEGERLYRWMLDQVGDKLHREPEEEPGVEKLAAVEEVKLPAEVEPVPALPVTVTVAQLRAFQPPKTQRPSAVGKADRPFQGFVRGDVAFGLEASFELAGPTAIQAANEKRTYHVQFYAHNLATGASIHLGSSEPDTLIKNQLSYTALLPEASLPPGRHRLLAVATVQTTPPIMGYLEVPILQVAQA